MRIHKVGRIGTLSRTCGRRDGGTLTMDDVLCILFVMVLILLSGLWRERGQR
jgi:hypothetical protein